METLVRVGLANAATVVALAAAVFLVTRIRHAPAAAHVLWVVVLARLLMPPLVPVPSPAEYFAGDAEPPGGEGGPARREPESDAATGLITWPMQPADSRLADAAGTQAGDRASRLAEPARQSMAAKSPDRTGPSPRRDAASAVASSPIDWTKRRWRLLVLAIWLAGSACLALTLALRVRRFAAVVRRANPAPVELREHVSRLWALIGAGAPPEVRVVDGTVSPMLCRAGGGPCVLFPSGLLDRLSADERDALLLHELAHHRRGDHWVRRLEVLVTALYWWHPVVWWVRREIHVVEEECCDAWVVRALPRCRRAYAEALVRTIDFLAAERRPVLSPAASGVARFGELKRRIAQIMTASVVANLSAPVRVALTGAAVAALAVFPASAVEEQAAEARPKPTAARRVQTREVAAGGIGRRFPAASGPLVLEKRPTPLNHAMSPMIAVTVSPDGRFVATGSGHNAGPGEVVLWDRETGRERFVHRHALGVRSVAFSPDGKLLATGHFDSTVQVREVETGEVLRVLRKHADGVNAVAFLPDGAHVVSGGLDNVATLWDAGTGEPVRTYEGHADDILSVSVTPDGETLASAGRDRTIRLWNIKTGETLRTLKGHTEMIEQVRFSPDGSRLASASWDGTVRVWDAASGEAVRAHAGHEGRVTIVAFSPDGGTLASGGFDRAIRLWDLATGESVAVISEAHGMPVFGLEFSPDGELLVSSSFDRTATIWDVATRTMLQTLERRHTPRDEPRPVVDAAWSADERWVATAHDNGEVRLTRAATGEVAAVLAGADDPASCVAFSPEDTSLAIGRRSGEVRLWDDPSAENATSRVAGRHRGPVSRVAFTSDGATIASGGEDGFVRLWDTGSGQSVGGLPADGDSVAALALAPDDRLLVSGHASGKVRLWDLESRAESDAAFALPQAIRDVAVSADGTTVAASDGATVRLWDLVPPEKRSPKGRLTLGGFEGAVLRLAFPPRSLALLTADASSSLRVWDPTTGASLATHKQHEGALAALAVAPQNRTVVSGGADGAGWLWHPRVEESRIGPLAAVPAHEKGARFIAFAGSRLITSGNDNRVRLWDLATGEEEPLAGIPDSVSGCELSPDGTRLAVGTWTKRLEMIDLDTGRPTDRFRGLEHGPGVVTFSPDGNSLAALCRDFGVKLYDLSAFAADPTVSIGKQGLPLVHAAFSPDSKTLVTCSGDWRRADVPGEVKLWDVATGELLGAFVGHASEVKFARFDEDGKRLATAGADKTVRVWDVETRRELALLPHAIGVFTATFLPHGDLLLTTDYAGTLTLWDLRTGSEVQRVTGHAELVGSVALSPDLTCLATAGRDGYVKLWALEGLGNDVRIVDGARH